MTVTTVATPSALETLCARVRAASQVGLDTEFHSERSYAPRLMVVQLAFDDGAAIVDPLALPDLAPLVDAMRETTVVGHALQSDLKIFADRFGAVPSQVFDCQIAASFLGYGMQISLAELVRDLRNVRLAKSQTVSDWSARPLTEKQIDYLVDDVAHLLPMRAALETRLQNARRLDWALGECAQLADAERYRPDERRAMMRIPGSNRMNRRELGILGQIVGLRDRVARERDVPPKYIMPDDVVAGLATLRPKRLDDLVQLRRLDHSARRTLGEPIIAAVRRGEDIPEDELPPRPARPLVHARETVVALLGVAVGEIARENDLPPGLLAPRASLERVARESPQDRGAFEQALDLTGWRLELLGNPLWRLLSGETSAHVEGYLDGDPKIRFSHDREHN